MSVQLQGPSRRAVVVGSARIPFARSSTAYVKLGNLEMLTAALKALVDKFDLKVETLGEVAAGAVIKHSRDCAQVLCTLKAWESEQYCRVKLGRDAPLGAIDRSKLNPKGGSIALGHPFAATGTRIVATLAKELAQRGSGRGLISICTAGGMGVTAILER